MPCLLQSRRRFSYPYTQEQVDKIFFAAASAADKQRLALAKMAVEETGMGVVAVSYTHLAGEAGDQGGKERAACERRSERVKSGCG